MSMNTGSTIVFDWIDLTELRKRTVEEVTHEHMDFVTLKYDVTFTSWSEESELVWKSTVNTIWRVEPSDASTVYLNEKIISKLDNKRLINAVRHELSHTVPCIPRTFMYQIPNATVVWLEGFALIVNDQHYSDLQRFWLLNEWFAEYLSVMKSRHNFWTVPYTVESPMYYVLWKLFIANLADVNHATVIDLYMKSDVMWLSNLLWWNESDDNLNKVIKAFQLVSNSINLIIATWKSPSIEQLDTIYMQANAILHN